MKLSHVVKVDMNINQEKSKTPNDLLDRMEQQLGARGRELLTKFIKSLDKLEETSRPVTMLSEHDQDGLMKPKG